MSLPHKAVVSFGFLLSCQYHFGLDFGNCQHANQVWVMLGSRSAHDAVRGSPIGRKVIDQKNILVN